VPGIFTSASLLAKDSRTGATVPWNPSPQKWVDGSIEGDIPTARIAEMFNVNHFIVSQVNPHVKPFLVEEQGPLSAQPSDSKASVEAGSGWLHTISHLAKDEALHRMNMISELGIFPNFFTKVSSLLSQRYSVSSEIRC
jgi:TAG lipase/steryl ester hydrolase/phospholipase A2/LPA acyltransferase